MAKGRIMNNPWFEISPEDYEGHMSAPQVLQLQALNRLYGDILEEYRPISVAWIGCCTGNGMEHVNSRITQRVVGIDIIPEYLEVVKRRYADLSGLEVYQADIVTMELQCRPVDLAIAPLFFEYVDLPAALLGIRRLLGNKGTLVAGLQMPSERSGEITETPFKSIEKLSAIMQLIDPELFREQAHATGFSEQRAYDVELQQGKRLFVGHYLKESSYCRGEQNDPR